MNKKYHILIIIFILMLFSLINNYSAGYILPLYQDYFIKELIWYIASFGLIFMMMKINLSFLFKYSFYLYLFGNLLLLLTLFIGTNVNGSTSWLIIGPFSFQASEFMKIFLILYLSYFTSKYQLSDFRYVIFSLLVVLIPSILTFLEPDTGALIPYTLIYLAFLINQKLNKWWYITSGIITVVGLVGFLIFYYGFQDSFINIFGTSFFYRMDRISDFLNGEGYQISKALTSIGASGVFGHGIRYIPEYFPEAPTDFAFALLINNIGLFGIVIFLIIYNLLIYHLIKMLNKKNQIFLLPVILVLFFQFSINILMNLGLFPIIGIALPFISYGGSNLISYLILIGLVVEHQKLLQ